MEYEYQFALFSTITKFGKYFHNYFSCGHQNCTMPCFWCMVTPLSTSRNFVPTLTLWNRTLAIVSKSFIVNWVTFGQTKPQIIQKFIMAFNYANKNTTNHAKRCKYINLKVSSYLRTVIIFVNENSWEDYF